MYELTVQRTFSAAHHLRDYDGPCARMHGHNYRVEISVAGPSPLQNGMLLDFGELKAICDAVLDELDHRCLNELPAFAEENVTSENLAAHIYHEIAGKLPFEGVRLARVRLWESDTSSVIYWED
jgi:6-pyruvoyltetrahydropterin/6-carboxytetrahydropterin synthase